MTQKKLSRAQREKVLDLLSRAVVNKQNPHPTDLKRASLVLYDVSNLGYHLEDVELTKLLDQAPDVWSDTMKEWLAKMTNAYTDLVRALNDPSYSKLRIDPREFDGLV